MARSITFKITKIAARLSSSPKTPRFNPTKNSAPKKVFVISDASTPSSATFPPKARGYAAWTTTSIKKSS